MRNVSSLASVGWGLIGLLLWNGVPARPPTPVLTDVQHVSAGRAHTCALSSNGAVQCWGSNTVGQLGLGEVSELTVRPTAVAVPGLAAGVRSIASGDGHNCVITAERSVVCWGLNGEGAVGSDATDYAVPTPNAVIGLTAPAQALSAGSEHSCAIVDGGAVRCWGNNQYGQLGDGTTLSRRTAVAVQALPSAALQISLGGEHSCAALANGETRCWGRNDSGQLGDGSRDQRTLPTAVAGLPGPIISLASGSIASCALSAAGALFCWGPQYPLAAFEGGSLTARAYPGFDAGYRKVVGGSFHFCALNASGAIKCLGDNADGQFGTGPIDGSLNTEFVVNLAAGVTDLAAGGWHNCATNSGGGLQCWGLNTDGQLGIDAVSVRLVPTPVAGLDNGIAAIAAGGFAGCALTTAGAVKCWGENGNGEAGDGTTLFRLTAVDVIGLNQGVRAIDSGDGSSCAITAERTVKCWGANFDGRLGNGDTLGSPQPVDVLGLGGDATYIAVGRQHACAVVGASAKCWGNNEFGQLGTGDLNTRLSATTVTGLSADVRSLAAGYYHTCAVVGSGIKCWGVNDFGQLGNNSRSGSLVPVDVLGLAGPVSAVSAGIVHTCALLQSGAVQCWGGSFFGNLLGNGNPQDQLQPGAVPALGTEVVQISLGSFHSCARLRDGAMRCWGQGGTIGDNTQYSRSVPTPVAGLNTGVQHISAGFGTQACAVVAGAAKCWGSNTFGQLGDGSTHGVPTAQSVLSNEVARRVARVTPAANAPMLSPQFDASGRYLVFESSADNLVTGDSNGLSDIFLLDRETNLLQRISVDNAGQALSGAAREPSISADGRRVVFVAPEPAAARLLGEPAKQRELRLQNHGNAVLLRNMQTGTTQLVAGNLPGTTIQPRISANGNAVVFTGVPADPAQGSANQPNVFVVPLSTNASSAVSVGVAQCVSCKSRDSGGNAGADANAPSDQAVVSADGQSVAYQSLASNALANADSPCPASSGQILLRNMSTGSTQRISPPVNLSSGQCGSSGGQKPAIDHSGMVVAFETDQGLDANDRNGSSDVYVWQAVTPDLMRASHGSDGTDTAAGAFAPQLSGDGKQIAFVSAAANHDVGFADNNDQIDLHVVGLDDLGSIMRLSRTANGAEANAATASPVLNFDGSQLGFASSALNLGASSIGQASIFARSNPLVPAKRSATWWLASESGWGLTVFDQGNLLTPTWFTYDVDGEPTWFIVSGAFPQADDSFRGDLFRLTGTPFEQIQGPATRTVSRVGEAALRYNGDTQLRFDYQVDGVQQSKSLQRFAFGNRGFSCAASPGSSRANALNYTDLWSGAGDDAGWGLTLFHIDAAVIAIWYTYDNDGEAVFFVISTTRQADGSFSGEVFRQRNGTPFSAINGSSPSPDSDVVGSARFRFLDGERATFSYAVNGFDRSHSINRLLVGNQASVCRTENLPE